MLRTAINRLSLCLCLCTAGCAVATQITNTPRSSTEQRLLVRALERSLQGLDANQLKGKTVTVEFFGLTPDKDFAREFFIAWLQAQGVRIAPSWTEAQLRLKVFASALAVDRGRSFIGAPSFTVPVIGFSVPEIALFRDLKYLGYSEIKISTTDTASGEFVSESAPAVGQAKHDDYTVLIIFHFTQSDPQEAEWNFGNR